MFVALRLAAEGLAVSQFGLSGDGCAQETGEVQLAPLRLAYAFGWAHFWL
jgi:hypothetical protein